MRNLASVVIIALAPAFILGACNDSKSNSDATSYPSDSAPSSTSSAENAPVMTEHDPATFRATLEELVAANKFGEATVSIRTADPQRQAAHDGKGYLAVSGIAIRLPGLEDEIGMYDPERDWVIPGTGDVVEFPEWQRAAEEFAAEYNKARQDQN